MANRARIQQSQSFFVCFVCSNRYIRKCSNMQFFWSLILWYCFPTNNNHLYVFSPVKSIIDVSLIIICQSKKYPQSLLPDSLFAKITNNTKINFINGKISQWLFIFYIARAGFYKLEHICKHKYVCQFVMLNFVPNFFSINIITKTTKTRRNIRILHTKHTNFYIKSPKNHNYWCARATTDMVHWFHHIFSKYNH